MVVRRSNPDRVRPDLTRLLSEESYSISSKFHTTSAFLRRRWHQVASSRCVAIEALLDATAVPRRVRCARHARRSLPHRALQYFSSEMTLSRALSFLRLDVCMSMSIGPSPDTNRGVAHSLAVAHNFYDVCAEREKPS